MDEFLYKLVDIIEMSLLQDPNGDSSLNNDPVVVWNDDPYTTPNEYDPELIWDSQTRDWIHGCPPPSEEDILVEDFIRELEREDELNKNHF